MLHNNDKITSFNDKFRYLFNILYIVQKMKFSINYNERLDRSIINLIITL